MVIIIIIWELVEEQNLVLELIADPTHYYQPGKLKSIFNFGANS